jgi:hypothetical protein
MVIGGVGAAIAGLKRGGRCYWQVALNENMGILAACGP